MELAPPDIRQGIGRALTLLRTRAGLSRDALAAAAAPPLSRSTVLKIERGERAPTPDTLRRLAHALSITTDELVVAAWICAEEDSQKRLERARAGIAAGLFGEPSDAVKVGALAGLGMIALLGAPIVVSAVAGAAAGSLVRDHAAKAKDARDVAALQQKVQQRIATITDPEVLKNLLQQLPDAPEPALVSTAHQHFRAP